jgi:hypothetical protein
MKATYEGYEGKKSSNYIDLPPVGAYIGEIQAAREAEQNGRPVVELFMEITEGEYKNRFHEVYEDQKERFGDNVKYKGIFRLVPYMEGDEDWRRKVFEENLWAVEQSNPGYKWDWDEKKLKGKKVGISIRKRLYTYNGKDRETTEIGRLESIEEIKAGKVKPLKDRDNRETKSESADSTDGSNFTDVSTEVSVPW